LAILNPVSVSVSRVVAQTAIVLAAAGMLAGCGPVPVGTTAVSQRDGHLVVAVMRCDDTALERVAVTHAGPLQSDAPRELFDDARWTTDQDDDIVVLDTARPGDAWDVVTRLGRLDAEEQYTVSAGGDTDHPMGSVPFTTAELAALPDGQWLTADVRPDESTGLRPTASDLDALRSEFCD
jgi:hypothetical protein